MATKKAGGSSRNGRDSIGGRLGVKKFGGEIVFTNEKTFSSTNLINRFSNELNEETKRYLLKVRKKVKILMLSLLILKSPLKCQNLLRWMNWHNPWT